ncbi:hypothetical protein [Paenibacillus periandrae]|nr:hypothetical protein [Paenibacillus periandrae]
MKEHKCDGVAFISDDYVEFLMATHEFQIFVKRSAHCILIPDGQY